MRRVLLCSSLFSLALGCAGDPASPLTGRTQSALELPSYFPTATSVQLRTAAADPTNPAAPTHVVTAALDADGLERLRDVTGQDALALVAGRDGTSVTLRDDGAGGDPVAGDGRFTAGVHVASKEVTDRALLEESLASAGALDSVARFDGHELVEYASRPPMSSADLAAGRDVSVTPLSTAPTPADFQREVEQSLFITDSAVIDDPFRTNNGCNSGAPDGVWTFEHLMRQLAGDQDPEQFVQHWLDQLADGVPGSPFTNGYAYGGNAIASALRAQWPRVGGELDLAHAPFKLLAIVPRLDLRRKPSSVGYNGNGAGGELRFVFGATEPVSCNALDFTVIFEYGVDLRDCRAQRAWADEWIALQGLDLVGDYATYAQALEALTLQVTEAGAAPGRIHGSALNQLRTNVQAGPQGAWFLREFHLEDTGNLEAGTVASTPANVFRTTATSFLEAFFLLPLTDPVPLTITDGNNQTSAFLGAEAIVEFGLNAPWGSPSSPAPTRHLRAIDTCSGCHGRETLSQTDINPTFRAHMVNPLGNATDANFLSTFLVGDAYPDPTAPHLHADPVDQTPRQFFDLLRRRNDLLAVSTQLCAELTVDDLASTTIDH